ncbi:hexosaminidase D-like [Schistocerca cancellata]|uniref:hexosaminidase D-like n=1 Tax=Schistocerca cancellata TaxID=274614 RepID=UPI002118C3A8|nr:hexosaminidase D-like [Schistocerca cancellata]
MKYHPCSAHPTLSPQWRRSPQGSRRLERVLHLDLKGAPPLAPFLRATLALAADAGATALLVEYEDAFPYWGELANLSAHDAYSVQQVRDLVEMSERLGMYVVPLVQTFGHLEMALKQRQWAHLREERAHPDAICPSHPQTMPFISEMIRQVLELHPHSRYIHIGCDEVFHLGTCSRCRSQRLEDWQLFSRHVSAVVGAVRALRPAAVALVWDDMLRRWPPAHVAASGLARLVRPVVWAYGADVAAQVPRFAWHAYATSFRQVWVASAFKGASGETALAPDLRRTAANHAAWMRLVSGGVPGSEVETPAFRGVVLTGWSRYDHFAALCETLPVALPSLLLALLVVDEAERQGPRAARGDLLAKVLPRWWSTLSCPRRSTPPSPSALEADPYLWRPLSACAFPGADAYAAVADVAVAVPRAELFLSEVRVRRGWLTPWHVSRNYSSPARLAALSAEASAVAAELESAWARAAAALSRHLPQAAVDEWLEQRLAPQRRALRALRSQAASLSGRDVWPRRPVPASGDD